MLHRVLFSISQKSFIRLLKTGYTSVDNTPQIDISLKKEIYRNSKFPGCLFEDMSSGMVRMKNLPVNLDTDPQDLSNFIPIKTNSLVLEAIIPSQNIKVIEFCDLINGDLKFRDINDLYDGSNCIAFTSKVCLDECRRFSIIQKDWNSRKKKIPQSNLEDTLKKLKSFESN